ncbi:putative sensory transducer protein YvaQ [Marinilactibacillus psychrotolerans]|uniref:methyl-accepting chemotaxis protein n=1 Tax=Marinilactibacillus psychrotolerans TaxID=191770 RepID=UPI001C7D30E3|nr:methyl-accepting chemotaxis protein [Marinilactibacillus psychrotolerans]GEQ32534.1 putative sensory transducer protein YvaQ [Marinilactibacillus psychrotolerans]
MKITTKLIVSYLSLAVIVIILGALSFLGLDRIYSNANELYNQRLQPSITLTEMAKTMENTRVQMLSGVANEDSARGEKAIANIERIDELITDYENRNMEKRESEKFSELKQNWQDFTEIVRQNVETLSAGMYIETLEGIARGSEPYTAASTNVSELIEIVDALATETYENDKEIYSADRIMIILTSIVATIMAIVIGTFMGRIIGVPLKKVSQKLDHISKGDLTEPVEVTKRKDEIGILINATSKMQEELKNLINSVADATVQVLSSSEELTQSTNEVVVGAEQVATTMQELATGAEAQANSTSEFSEHMQKFSETIEDSSKESEKIYQTSTNVYSLTKDGREMMANSVDGVKELDVKSGEISKLVGVIESIAEQTNLLALNAAIEAARVGDQGKGFAVVADEIRQLAEQASVSVVDITDIVNNIQSESAKLVVGLETGYEQVEKGTSQIQQTGETFNKISSSVESMGNAIKEISNRLAGNRSTTKNMSTNIEEIAGLSEQSAAGIEQTSATAQQTTSTMQEVSSSSEELANLAEKLSNLVERFKI